MQNEWFHGKLRQSEKTNAAAEKLILDLKNENELLDSTSKKLITQKNNLEKIIELNKKDFIAQIELQELELKSIEHDFNKKKKSSFFKGIAVGSGAVSVTVTVLLILLN